MRCCCCCCLYRGIWGEKQYLVSSAGRSLYTWRNWYLCPTSWMIVPGESAGGGIERGVEVKRCIEVVVVKGRR